MPNDMSNYANRQSPNQQAKIASMMNATMGNKGLSDGNMRNLRGYDPPMRKTPNPTLADEDMRPVSQSLGRMAANPEANRRYKLASSDRIENQRAQREARDAAGGQAGGSWPEDQARHYAPYPIHYETGEPMTDRAGDMVQDYHDYMTAGSSFVPSGPPSPDSPGRGTQYGEDIAGRPEPEYTHNVANRQTPAQHIGGQYRGAENTYITLSGGEQQQYQQFGYIDINGIRYARGPNGEMMNMGGSPEFGTPGVTNPGQGY
jgi:hypothetical protein